MREERFVGDTGGMVLRGQRAMKLHTRREQLNASQAGSSTQETKRHGMPNCLRQPRVLKFEAGLTVGKLETSVYFICMVVDGGVLWEQRKRAERVRRQE